MAFSRTILLSLVLFSFWNYSNAQDGFFFTIPKVLRAGDPSEFCLTAYSTSGDSRTISFILNGRTSSETVTEVSDDYDNGQQKCTTFTAPAEGEYELLLREGSTLLERPSSIVVLPHKEVILIQTDKPLYKPGEIVQFRILTIQGNQKPWSGKIAAVYIKGPSGSKVKQYKDVDTEGIASLEFELPKGAKPGSWQIVVFLTETEDPTIKEDAVVAFAVKDYAPPKFDVKITPPSIILGSDNSVEGTVCAVYSYGKDVHAHLDLTICGSDNQGHALGDHRVTVDSNAIPFNNHGGANLTELYGIPNFKLDPQFLTHLHDKKLCHYQSIEINGCHTFTTDIVDLRGGGDHAHHGGWQLRIDASVTEFKSGSVVNQTSLGPSLTVNEMTLTLKDDSNGYFKPGLPFHGKVLAEKSDGTPARGERIHVAAYDTKARIVYAGNFTTNDRGEAYYVICGEFGKETSSISLSAQALDHRAPAKGMFSPVAHSVIRQWFSPSFSYIQIPWTEDKHECDKDFNMKIPFTTRADTQVEFRYQVIARGKVVHADSAHYHYDIHHPGHHRGVDHEKHCLIPHTLPTPAPTPPPVAFNNAYDAASSLLSSPNNDGQQTPNRDFEEPIVRSEFDADLVSSFDLTIPVTPMMSPKFTLVIHHVLSDGEVVADTKEFHVKPCFTNKVSMRFNKTAVIPGEGVHITLEAAPQSLCAVGVVDKEGIDMEGNHQITMDTILHKLEALSIDDSHWSTTHTHHHDQSDKYCEQQARKFFQGEVQGHKHSDYVDSIQAFKSSGLLVLTDLKLETRPCKMIAPVRETHGFPMHMSAHKPPVPVHTHFSIAHHHDTFIDSVVSHFPDTWLWQLHWIGSSGSLHFPKSSPEHTMTSWMGNAVCVNAEKGVGVSPLQQLTTIEPLFIHLEIPESAVQGEKLPVVFTVHNYVETCLQVNVSIITDATLQVFDTSNSEPFCLCPGETYTHELDITATEIGSHDIEAQASIISTDCGASNKRQKRSSGVCFAGKIDKERRKIRVKGVGLTKEFTHTLVMCAKARKRATEYIKIPVPHGVLPYTAIGEINVVGDALGFAMSNMGDLVDLPTKCGEQNMIRFTPIVHLLNYLAKTGGLTDDVRKEATKHMDCALTQQLNYRKPDGSYSAFEGVNEQPSVWLTAYVVKSFALARPFIYIDIRDLQQSIGFLRNIQSADGCWKETGPPFASYMTGGLGKQKTKIPLTSFVLIALMKAGVSNRDPSILRGFKCIDGELSKMTQRIDVYTLAIAAYANTLYSTQSTRSKEMLAALNAVAKSDGFSIFWEPVGVKLPHPDATFPSRATSATIETSSYALMAMMLYYGKIGVEFTRSTALWLSKQQNSRGGFSSTQDTVVALEALSEFSQKVYDGRPTSVVVTVSGNRLYKIFDVADSSKTKLKVQTTPVTNIPNQVRVDVQGTGCAVVQVSVQASKLPQTVSTGKPHFYVTVTPLPYQFDKRKCDRQTLSITIGGTKEYRGKEGKCLIRMKMVTGWAPSQYSVDYLTKTAAAFTGIKAVDYDMSENLMTFYYHECMLQRTFKLDVEQNRQTAVSKPRDAYVSVLSYYNTGTALSVQKQLAASIRKADEVSAPYNLKTTCGFPTRPGGPVQPPRPVPVQPQKPGPVRPRPPFQPRPQKPDAPKTTESPEESTTEDFASSTMDSTTDAGTSGTGTSDASTDASTENPTGSTTPEMSDSTTDEALTTTETGTSTTEALESTTAPNTCPLCIDEWSIKKIDFSVLDPIVCSSSSVYVAVGKGRTPDVLKLKFDVLKPMGQRVNKVATLSRAQGCQCKLLDSPVKKIAIFTSPSEKNNNLVITDKTAIIKWDRKIHRHLKNLRVFWPCLKEQSTTQAATTTDVSDGTGSTTDVSPYSTTVDPSATTPDPSATTPEPVTTTVDPSATTPDPSATTDPSASTDPSATTPDPSATTPEVTTTAMETTTGNPCPLCIEKWDFKTIDFQRLDPIVCKATSAYIAEGLGWIPQALVVKEDLLQTLKKPDTQAHAALPPGCECKLMDPPVEKLVIFTSPSLDDKNKMSLSDQTAVIKWDKNLDRQLAIMSSLWPCLDAQSTTSDPSASTSDSSSDTPDPSATTPDPSATTIDSSSETPDPSASTPTDSSSDTPDPSATTADPSATTPDPSATTPDPSTTPEASTTTAMETTTADPCPVCIEKWDLKTVDFAALDPIVCKATNIYVGAGIGRAPSALELTEDRLATPTAINKPGYITMPAGCSCSLLNPPVEKLVVITSPSLDRYKLVLSAKTAIIKWDKAFDKQLAVMDVFFPCMNDKDTTVNPSETTADPSASTLDPSASTPDSSATTQDSSSLSPDPSATTPDHSATTDDSSTETPDPSASTQDPSATTEDSSSDTPDPSATTPTVDPSATTPTVDPSATTPDSSSQSPDPSATTPQDATTTPDASTTPDVSTTPMMETTTAIPCPLCIDKWDLKAVDFQRMDSIVCQATNFYWVTGLGFIPNTVTVKKDLLGTPRTLNKLAHLDLPPGCECKPMTPPVDTLIVITASSLEKDALKLSDQTAVIKWDKNFDKQLKIKHFLWPCLTEKDTTENPATSTADPSATTMDSSSASPGASGATTAVDASGATTAGSSGATTADSSGATTDGSAATTADDSATTTADGSTTPVPETTTAPACPLCIEDWNGGKVDRTDLDPLVCKADSGYIATGKSKPNSVKLRVDLLKTKWAERKVNKPATLVMPPGCDCPLLKSPVPKLVIFTPPNLSGDKLTLDQNSAIIKWDDDLEKNTKKRKTAFSCSKSQETTTENPSGITVDSSGSTSDPSETTADSSGGTSDPSETTADSSGSTSDPSETTADSSGSTSDPSETTAGSSGSTSDPSETTADSSGSTSDPSETTADSSGSTSDPSETTAGSSGSTSDPSETTKDSSGSTSDPSETTEDSSGSTSDPSETTEDSSGSTSDPSETTEDSSDKTEGSPETTQDSSTTAMMDSTTTVNVCPMCIEEWSTADMAAFDPIACASTSVYVVTGKGKKKSLRFRQDYLATPKAMNEVASYEVPGGCSCPELEPPVKRLAIFTNEGVKNGKLPLSSGTAVIQWSTDLEKFLKKLSVKWHCAQG